MRVSLNLLKMDLLRLVKSLDFWGGIVLIFFFLWFGIWDDFKISSADVVYYVSLFHLTIFYQLSLAKNKVGHYSMGMRQRLGIAQSIMERPRLLILDEPMNGLDEDGVSEMRSLFNDLKRKGTTIVLATHNLDDMKILCDFVYEMKKGDLQPKGAGQSGGDGELS